MNISDHQTLPIHTHDANYSDIHSQQVLSPLQATIVAQQQEISTPNNNARIVLFNTPKTSICPTNGNQSITSPMPCATHTMKQQSKLAGSNLFRCYYSSII